MNTKSVRLLAGVVIAVLGTGCGDLVRQGRGPSQVVLNLMQAASGAEPETFGGTLSSDVITNVERQIGGQTVLVPTVFSDIGQVTMSLILKDPGPPGVGAEPGSIN